jgi:hypothetical protein
VVVSASVFAMPMRSTRYGRKNEPHVVSPALSISACEAWLSPSEYLWYSVEFGAAV